MKIGKTCQFEDLGEFPRRALEAAEVVMERAYSPYSRFYVGAALYTSDGTVISGANYENAGYSSICAERAAVVSANSQGLREFAGICVIGRGESQPVDEPVSPCGVCRQVLNEVAQLSGVDLAVIMSSTRKDRILVAGMSELLPQGFGPDDIGVNIERYRKVL